MADHPTDRTSNPMRGPAASSSPSIDPKTQDGVESVVKDRPPELSVVLPLYNEEATITELAARLDAISEQVDASMEFLWVDDGSTDRSAEVVSGLGRQDSRHRLLSFSRNFGHMAALTAGLEHAQGTGAVITMDSDGQHPPEIIPELVAHWRNHNEIVQAVRTPGPSETWLKSVTSRGFYALLNGLSGMRIPAGAADYRLLDRRVVDQLNAMPERARFIRGLVHWLGFETRMVPFQASPREMGHTKYSYWKMLSFAAVGITSFSLQPLQFSMLLGCGLVLSTLGYALYIVRCLVLGIPLVPGWTSTLFAIMLLGGFQLISIGVISAYIAQIFTELKQRPIYVLRSPRNLNDDD